MLSAANSVSKTEGQSRAKLDEMQEVSDKMGEILLDAFNYPLKQHYFHDSDPPPKKNLKLVLVPVGERNRKSSIHM